MEKQIKVIEYGIDNSGMMGVKANSFVNNPAIEVDFVFMKSQRPKPITFATEQGEQRMVYGAVMIPDKLILRADKQTNEPYYAKFSAELIKDQAHKFLMNNAQRSVTLMHEIPIGGAVMVESWIVGENDKSKDFGFDLPVGTWFAGYKIENDELWQMIKAGEIKGFSIEGFFELIDTKQTAPVEMSVDEFLSDLDALMK